MSSLVYFLPSLDIEKKARMAKTAKPTTSAEKQENLLGENTVLTLTLTKEAVENEYKIVLKREAGKVTLKGFRQGKAPIALAESYIGHEKLMDHVLNHLLPHAYEEAVKEHGLIPLVQPQFSAKETKEGDTLTFEAVTALAPEITLGDYKKLIATGNEKYKKHVSEASEKHEHSEDEQLQTIFVTLINEIKPKIAPALLQEEMNQQLNQLFSQLSQRNISLENYIKSQGKSEEEFRQDLAALSLGALQLEFVLQAITKDLGLKVTQADIDAWLKTQNYPEGTSLPQELRIRLEASLLRRKTTDEILKIANK